jgi:MFS family permease
LSKVGQVMGILMISWGIGSALGPYIGGFSFDLTGTYQPAFLLGGAIMLLMVFSARHLGN